MNALIYKMNSSDFSELSSELIHQSVELEQTEQKVLELLSICDKNRINEEELSKVISAYQQAAISINTLSRLLRDLAKTYMQAAMMLSTVESSTLKDLG